MSGNRTYEVLATPGVTPLFTATSVQDVAEKLIEAGALPEDVDDYVIARHRTPVGVVTRRRGVERMGEIVGEVTS